MNESPKFRLSVITPAFNEAQNLPLFHEELRCVLDPAGVEWEWIVVDDHSSDGTWGVLQELAAREPRLKAIRLARNSGSHTAFACGLHQARGDCAVVLAADLQDPPDTIPALLDKWRQGAKIVWAVRDRREGESAATKGFSRLYYWLMRRFVGMADTPETGADFFLVDRRVMEVLKAFKETNVSLLALLTWMGFRQDRIAYVKKARQHGASGWSLGKKLKLVVDSITAFTYKPIRWMSYVGFGVALIGFGYALVVVVNRVFFYTPVQGYASLIVAILLIGGLQMMMMGVLGEYIWRALDEARNRPRFIVEDETAPRGEPAGES
jgi:polyisoprenyl-phosphate glycosyltransferase